MTAELTPFSREAEQAVLGSVFISPARVSEMLGALQTDDFLQPDHREIYEAMARLHAREKPVDPILVADELKAVGALARLDGGETYLLTLANAVPLSEQMGHYVEVVAQKALLRRIVATAAEIRSSAAAGAYDARELLADSTAKLTELALRRGGAVAFKPFRQDLEETLAALEARSQAGGKITGVRSGIWKLDKLILGFQPGGAYVIAARPGLGKTSLALNIAVRHARQGGNRRSLIFSLEMTRRELVERILTQEAPIDHSVVRAGIVRNGQIDRAGWLAVIAAHDRLLEAGIQIDDESVTPDAIEARTNAYRAKYPDADMVVVIDYLQLAHVERQKGESTADAVGRFSGRLKRMAKRLRVPVIEVCQINRESEKDNRPPRNSDLRQSGQIEQDADAIVFIHDSGVQLEEGGSLVNTEDGPVDILVTKNRAGRQGALKARWVGRFCSFYDVEAPREHDGGFVAPAPPVNEDEDQRRMW